MKLLLALAASAAASTNLILNGGFEDNAAQYCKAGWCVTTDKAIAPWKSSGEVEVDSTPWKNHGGDWSIDLCANKPYQISQEVKLEKGIYEFSFFMNQNRCEQPIKTLNYGIIKGNARATGTDQKMSAVHEPKEDWVRKSLTFDADEDGVYTVVIDSTTPGSCGPTIDDVELIKIESKVPGGRRVKGALDVLFGL